MCIVHATWLAWVYLVNAVLHTKQTSLVCKRRCNSFACTVLGKLIVFEQHIVIFTFLTN